MSIYKYVNTKYNLRIPIDIRMIPHLFEGIVMAYTISKLKLITFPFHLKKNVNEQAFLKPNSVSI